MEIQNINISEIKNNPNNPRLIKDDKFKKLVKSIKDFPEMLKLRPIVVNDEMIVLGGNMRLKACKEAGVKKIPIIKASSLTEQQQKEFIIKDNIGYGQWEWDTLANSWEVDKLTEWGLEIPDINNIDKMEDDDVIEFEQSVQLEPPKEYILIMAEPNSIEWEDIKETLKLKMVRRGGYKSGSAFDAIGLERVLNWEDFKERYVNSNTK